MIFPSLVYAFSPDNNFQLAPSSEVRKPGNVFLIVKTETSQISMMIYFSLIIVGYHLTNCAMSVRIKQYNENMLGFFYIFCHILKQFYTEISSELFTVCLAS